MPVLVLKLQLQHKYEFIKLMNNLGYQVNWIDTRKYITYTTPDGYKSREINYMIQNLKG